jgi:hypothetical protein
MGDLHHSLTGLRWALVLIPLAAVSACGSGKTEPPAAQLTPTTIVFQPVPTRAPLPGLAEPVASSAPPSSLPVDPAAAESPAATAPATVAPPPPTSPVTTTEPVAVQGLELSGEGIGSAIFGADPDGVVDYVSSFLGSNTGDTGWVDPYSFGVCEGGIARKVDWGVLSLLFSDLSRFANGRRHFMGWEYGKHGQIGDEPVGLRTAGGVTLGSRVVDLLAEFPDASVNAGDPEIEVPDNFFVSTVFYGLLTGPNLDDYITVMFGGYGCGE